MDRALIVREFAWDDYPAVADLWLEAFGRVREEDEPEGLAGVVARNPGLFLVAVLGDRLAGTVVGTFDGRRGYLYHVAVAARAQRQGVGRAMIREIEARLHALGARRIYFRVNAENERALAFYHALGYATTERILHLSRSIDE